MPNRVDENVSGMRPTTARQGPQQANPPRQAADRGDGAQANQPDRVEISIQAQAGQPQPPAAGDVRRMAAAGRQGAVDGAEERRAQQVRQQQDAARQQAAARPPQRPGNLVDVTG